MRTPLKLGLFLALLLTAGSVCADTTASQAPIEYQNLLDAFKQAAALWNAPLQAAALGVFWGLATIELCWVGFTVLMRGGDLNDFMWEMIKLILFLGLFYQLVLKGPAYANAIIQSFQQAGNLAVAASGGTTDINPTGILSLGLKTALIIMSFISVNPLTAVGIIIGALVVMACFAYIAAIYAVTLLETYIVIGASVLFYAFGGSRWSVDIAKRVFFYCFSAGAKLFVLQLIAGTAYALINSWAAGYTNDNGSMFGMIGLSLMIALVSAMLPSLIQAVTAGASTATLGAAMSVAGMAAGAAVGSVAAVVGGSSAVSAAASLANAQRGGGSGGSGAPSMAASFSGGGTIEGAPNLGGPMSGRSSGAEGGTAPSASSGGNGSSTRASKPASYVGQVAKNFAGAAGGELMAHLAGKRRHMSLSTAGFRMADSMNEQTALLNKPPLPGAST